MHIPDGFLDAKTAITTGIFSLSSLGAALRQANRHVRPRQIPLIGLSAAFIFVAQMVNFPVAGGTSGHLVGAALAAVLLGPSGAVIVLTCVLLIQALIFADGGLLALGANVFNMGVVAPVCAYGAYRLMHRDPDNRRSQLVAASLGAWISTVVAAGFCAGELALSGTTAWSLVFPAMVGLHSLIGIGEGVITMLVLAAIARTRPELLGNSEGGSDRGPLVVYGLVIILGLLILVVPYASTLPDGLTKVAQSLGFDYRATALHQIPSPLQGYAVPGITSPETASVIAGLIGAVLVFGLSVVLARILVPKQSVGTTPATD